MTNRDVNIRTEFYLGLVAVNATANVLNSNLTKLNNMIIFLKI